MAQSAKPPRITVTSWGSNLRCIKSTLRDQEFIFFNRTGKPMLRGREVQLLSQHFLCMSNPGQIKNMFMERFDLYSFTEKFAKAMVRKENQVGKTTGGE